MHGSYAPSWEELFSMVMLQPLHLTPLTRANMCPIKQRLEHHKEWLQRRRQGPDVYQEL